MSGEWGAHSGFQPLLSLLSGFYVLHQVGQNLLVHVGTLSRRSWEQWKASEEKMGVGK